jgi:hypothetical protein
MIIIPERSALPGHRHAKDTSHLGQIRRRLLEPTVGVEANDGGLVAVPTEFWVSMASELNNRPSPYTRLPSQTEVFAAASRQHDCFHRLTPFPPGRAAARLQEFKQ